MYISLRLLTLVSAAANVFAASSRNTAAIPAQACPQLLLPPPFLHPPYLTCPLSIDESTVPSPIQYTPWTHLPTCLESVRNPKQKYCIFTNSRQGFHGVSIITRPELAAASVDLLHKPFIPTNTRSLTGTHAYEVVDIPGKGKGVVATRRIQKAEPFMADSASLILAVDFPISVLQLDGYELLHEAVDKLPDPGRILGLGRSSEGAADIVEDVARTNSFSFELGDEAHMAVYPEIARLNHACKPNAFVRFLPDNLGATVLAFRDIEPGEELTISYIPMARPTEERLQLLGRWGFNCTCALCTSPTSKKASSDYRRNKIRDMRDGTITALRDGDGTRAVRLSLEVLRLARMEELVPLYSETYYTLATVYWHAGNKEEAKKYAQLSVQTLEDQGYIVGWEEQLEVLMRNFEK